MSDIARRVRTNRYGDGASQRNPGIVNGESDPTEAQQAILPAQLIFPTGRIDGDTVFDRSDDLFCWTPQFWMRVWMLFDGHFASHSEEDKRSS